MSRGEHEANRQNKSATKVAPAPPPALHLRAELGAKPGFAARKNKRIIETVLAVSLLAFLAVLAFFGGGLVAERLTNWIPVEVDVQFGRAYAQSLSASGRLCPYAAGQDALREFARPLVVASGSGKYQFDFFLVQDDVPNAYALPGGQVMVTQGLLQKVESADELAGVLAHEIQHVHLRHSMKTLMRQLGTSVALSVLLGGAASTVDELGASRLVELSYGREAEREADLQGALILKELGYHPQAFTQLLQRIAAEHPVSVPPLLSSHPGSQEREELLAGIKRRQVPPPIVTRRLNQIECYDPALQGVKAP